MTELEIHRARINWLAAAIYATRSGDAMRDRTPTFEELPQRIQDKWRQDAEAWLSALRELELR